MFLAPCLAVALFHPLVTPIKESYTPLNESFGNLVKFLNTAYKGKGNPHFHGGASLIGGVIDPKGQFTYSIVTHDDAPHIVVISGENSAKSLDVDVVDKSKKSVVQDRVKGDVTVVTFKGGARLGLTIIAKNTATSGDGVFASLAILVDGVGVEYPTSSITKASRKMSAAIQAGFGKGYGITPNQPVILGNLMEPGTTYSRFGKVGDERWMAIAACDTSLLTLDLSVLDKAKNQVNPTDVSESDTRLYELKSPASSISMQNSGKSRILAFTGIL